MLDAKFFSGNRTSLRSLLKIDGVVMLTASGLVQRSGDSVYPFRQDSNFYYLTGLLDPDLILVMDLGSGDEFIILPNKSEAETTFGGEIYCDDLAKMSGIDTVYDYTNGWKTVNDLRMIRKNVYTVTAPPVRITHTDSFYTNGNRRRLMQKLKRAQPASPLCDIRAEFTKLRQVKQKPEIEAIRSAIACTTDGLRSASAQINQGVTSYQLKAELDYVFARNGTEHGFTPIVSSGKDTCVMHSTRLDKKVAEGDQVLFDIGAEHQLYCADISRTYFCGTPTPRQKEVYDAVLRVQRAAEKLIRPGVGWRDYVIAVDYIMGEELIKSGLITENTRKEVHKYFPHAISHSLGLDAHDPCDYTQPMQENMVLTIEPGIYIPEEGIGIRIEDDYIITKNGISNLSGSVPR